MSGTTAKRTKRTVLAASVILIAALISACGNVKPTPAATAGGSTSTVQTPTTSNLGGIGVNTKTIAHSEFYNTGTGNHAAKRDGNPIGCMDCHGVPREQVCSQSGCHPFGDYATSNTSITNPALTMRNFDHTANNTGSQCGNCHKPAPLKTAGETPHISGFRGQGSLWSTIKDTSYHTSLRGKCLDCHAINTLTTPYPSSNHPANTNTNCEFCHYYSVVTVAGVQKGKWSGAHGDVAGNCAASGCHNANKNHNTVAMQVPAQTFPAAYGCEKCHTKTNTGSFTTWSGAQGVNFHAGLTGTCLDCHTIATIPNFPSSHTVASGRTTACENCHYYKVVNAATNAGQWAGGHAAVTTGCVNCHTKSHGKYGGGFSSVYDCVWCHTGAVAAKYTTWKLNFSEKGHRSWDSRSCVACHFAGSTFGD